MGLFIILWHFSAPVIYWLCTAHPLPTHTLHTVTVEDEKESESKVREDTMELLPSAKNGRGFVAEYSDESDVVYEKQTNNINS